jgi:small subunit ribosomal protein S16
MLRIRFLRVGKKNSPSFRLVLTEKTAPPKGKFLEVLGFYNPKTKDWGMKGERIAHWISCGAQPSATAHNFLVKHGALQTAKISVHSKSKHVQEESASDGEAETPDSTKEADSVEAQKEAPEKEVVKEEAPAAPATPESA